MSVETTASPAVSQPVTSTRGVVTAAGTAGALASAGFVASVFSLHGMSQAEVARAPVTVTTSLVAGLAYIALALSLPLLAGSIRLPRWVLLTTAVGAAFIAIQAWADGSVIAHVANSVSDDEFDRLGKTTFLLQLNSIPMTAACLVGFVAAGIVGWRRRAMPRGACVLFILAGLVSLIGTFPPVGLLAGLALAWTARSAPVRPE
ncbi:hypothetical protein [Pseudofrankia sp. DC12]|uniref:hypothetical protein n=1 Tax=Pseudofrankia sp. DC12 TaxID=683315 RepID=UPI0005F7D8F5|nr:hypothetical protein [Pseudofrankia sp. DC12]